ncbi:MAG: PH domain-containing protein [Defluviitaleaceae bacterium]|nr:PH domain-containing protein [Defluviitaleaceae bacterium]MCL2836523.1 PH domain-containing protein [Defluviitaleaceae bacterium]
MKKLFVKRTVGWGYSFNTETKLGKVLLAVTLLAVAVFICLILFGGPNAVSLVITGTEAEIKSPGIFTGSFNFSTNDIKSVAMIENFPSVSRRVGTGSPRLYAGRFDVAGYGRGNVYIHRNNPPYIVMELEGGWVFLNGQTPDETRAFFNTLNNIQ